MAFRGVYIKMPDEVVDLLDALAPHIGELPPARVGRTSVLLALIRDGKLDRYARDPHVAQAIEAVADLMDRSRV